jgi:GT2 family glycosyltransferase
VAGSTAIVWLNYNSGGFINLIYDSLRSIGELDYDKYFLYVIDNGSSDDSPGLIRDFLASGRMNYRFIQLSRNLGFSGGNDVVWEDIVRRGFKYVALVNNDFIVDRDSLSTLIDYLDKYDSLLAVQGIHEFRSSGLIGSYGFYVDEMLMTHSFMFMKPVSYPRRCYAVSYASGAYVVYHVDRLKWVLKESGLRYPFIPETFLYFDDSFIGFLGWNYGLHSWAVPCMGGRHMVSITTRVSGFSEYMRIRSQIIKMYILSSRFRSLGWLWVKRNILHMLLQNILYGGNVRLGVLGIPDGLDAGKLIRRKYNVFIDMSRVPMIKIGLNNIVKGYFYRRKLVEDRLDLLARECGFNC